MADTHLVPDVSKLDPTVKDYVAAGFPLILPSAMFRRVVPMGPTHFYAEIKAGRLRAVKLAGGAAITLEEALRYRSALPEMPVAAAAA